MKPKYGLYFFVALIVIGFVFYWSFKQSDQLYTRIVGQPMDSLNGVVVYYNGDIENVSGRNKTADGYNLGLKYQCVEFVKRYYYEHLHHKMPNSYGHAKDFFDTALANGVMNTKRGLLQYANPGISKPQVDDIIVFSGTAFNQYGHVAIISNVSGNEVEIIQQNPGPSAKSRVKYSVTNQGGKWKVDNDRVLGWLRKE